MMGEANVNKHGKKRNAMLWENASSLHTGYLQVGGSLIREEFFKAAYHGIPKAERQVIRVKKRIYSMVYLQSLLLNCFPKGAAHKHNSP